MRFACLIGLGSEVGGSRSTLGEEAGEHWLDQRTEDDLSTTSLGESHPEDKDELEGIVEGEPVDCTDSTLENVQECINDPVGQPLGIVGFTSTEQSLQREVPWDQEPGKVHQEIAGDVEEDHEEVDAKQSEESVDFRHRSLFLHVVEHRILGQLLINLVDLVVGAVLERHVCDVLVDDFDVCRILF